MTKRWSIHVGALIALLLSATFLHSQQPPSLSLPIAERPDLKDTVVSIKNKGEGTVIEAVVENPLSNQSAIVAESQGNGPALRARAKNSGAAIEGITTGTGSAANFRNDSAGNVSPVIEVSTAGTGPAAIIRGDVKIEGDLKLRGANIVPIGAILPFWGDPATLDEAWVLCDGRTITTEGSPMKGKQSPNLIEMFLRGANGQGQLGITGGRDSVPDHSHYYSSSASVWVPMKSGNGYVNAYPPANSAGGFDNSLRNLSAPVNAANPYESHGHMDGTAYVSGQTYGGGGGDNRPRFTSVHFILRVK